jgi:hypothetical protein
VDLPATKFDLAGFEVEVAVASFPTFLEWWQISSKALVTRPSFSLLLESKKSSLAKRIEVFEGCLSVLTGASLSWCSYA